MELLSGWVAAFVERAAAKLSGPEEPSWAARLVAALPTLGTARRFWLARGDAEAAAQLSVHLDDFALWRDYPEPWSWAIELAEEPRLHGTPVESLLMTAAGRGAWRLGRLELARELADRALAKATDARSRGRALEVSAVVELFCGHHAAALEQTLESARLDAHGETATRFATAALAAVYGGQDGLTQELLNRADALADSAGGQTIGAYTAYARGEVLAELGDPAASRHLERAVQLSTVSGASFVAAIAAVTLASSAARRGELVQASARYVDVIRYWARTGSWTQQWTTLRNVAELLAQCGRDADAALLLAAADADPDAPAVVGADAARLSACRHSINRRLGDAEMQRLGRAAGTLSRGEVVQLALEAVQSQAGSPPGERPH